jgi:putative ABC transport system permease protein
MKQYWALLWINLASIPERLGLVLTIVIGVACAVGVLASMLAMGEGARRQAMGAVRADHLILLSVGAQAPMQSSIARDVAALIGDLPGIKRNAQGKPIVVAQMMVYVQARDRATGRKIGFAVFGVGPGITDYSPEFHLTSGRLFKPGLREIIASNVCAMRYADFARGDRRRLRGGDWQIVGNFDIGHTGGNCIVFADAAVVLSAFSRDNYNQINVRLDSPERAIELSNSIAANPALHVVAKSEAELTEEGTKQLNAILAFVAYFVGSIMAVAATLGAANSLYAVVDGRRRELATLRALGFRSFPIIASMMTEAILLSLPGALLGVGLAWLLFNGLTASPFGLSFQLAVSAPIAAVGICWALVMGLVGGVLPALRAARVPVTAALRAT